MLLGYKNQTRSRVNSGRSSSHVRVLGVEALACDLGGLEG